jgi:predicted O-linked N-acetylglucosamine transferase (SPINDLY family)
MSASTELTQARVAFAAGDAARAYALAQQLIARDRDDVAALSIAANAAMQLQRLDDADVALNELLRLRPDDAAIARSRSRLLNRIGHRDAEQQDLTTAAQRWRNALRLWPDNDDAAFNLVLHGAATLDDDEAIQILQGMLARNPDDLGARRLLAEIERNRGDTGGARQHLHALDDATLRVSEMRALVLTLNDTDLIERSLPESLEAARVVDIGQAAFATLSTLQDTVAAQTLTSALERRHPYGGESPTLRLALARELSLPALHADRESIFAARRNFERGLSRLTFGYSAERLRSCAPRLAQLNWSNFLLAYHCEDDLALQSRYGDWLCMAAATLRPDLAHPNTQRKPGPPRIGLLSGHWHLSTAGSYFASWIDALALPEFDTQVFALGPRFDVFTDALESRCRHFVRLDGDIDRAAEIIRDADLDLLIYPELGMDTRLLPLAALRLARCQWAGWGHPVSTGLASIDAFLSCADMEPSDAVAHYRESLLLLPDLGTRYHMPPRPQRHDREALGLPPGKLIVVPQSLFKIHPDNDAVLHDLLALQPDANVLMFATTSRLEVHLLRQRLLKRLGSTLFRRLLFYPMVSRSRFLELLACADLMLDNLHWSGGNTSLDALRSGLPIATARSRFMRGRQSAAMLQALGLDTAIAATPNDLAGLAHSMLRGEPMHPDQDRLEAYLSSDRPARALQGLARQAVAGVV